MYSRKHVAFRIRSCGFVSHTYWLCGHLIAVNLNFLTCKMGILTPSDLPRLLWRADQTVQVGAQGPG